MVGNRVYFINSGSEAKYYSEIFPTLERMISSFEFTSNEATPLYGRSSMTSSSAMKRCLVCDASMSEDSLFCANCGAKFEQLGTYSATGVIGGEKKSLPHSATGVIGGEKKSLPHSATGVIGGEKRSLPSLLRSTKGISFMGTMVVAAVIIFLLINQYVVAPADCAKEKDRLEKERVRMWPDATTEQWASWGDDLEQYRNQCDKDWMTRIK